MKLRIIVLLLSSLVLLSTFAGGLFYFRSLQESALSEARRHAASRAVMISNQFSSFLSQNLRPARTLAGMEELQELLQNPGGANLAEAHEVLDHFQSSLEVDVCYLMDHDGTTVATSNRSDPDSFLGSNFDFRPYFQDAIKGRPVTYMALGTASNKRGVYYSQPVLGSDGTPLGVVVVKASVSPIENEIIQAYEGTVVITDPHGVIFLSSRRDWLFQTLWKLSDGQVDQIADSKQFGRGPWEWIGFELKDHQSGFDQNGREYMIHEAPIEEYPGWKVIYLRSLETITSNVIVPIIRTTGSVILGLFLLTGVAVFYLFRKANTEIVKRRAVEKELRESKDRYRSLYHNTPALLHSIDASGRLVSVSDYWTETLGYTPKEVVGRRLSDFMTEESRAYAEAVVIKEFFRSGSCQDIPYRFVKKNGEFMDVLLSAIAERDRDGRIVRSLAVIIDITERKRAEEALEAAKEQLSQYSKNLERQVRERTREFTGILEHTPAVVYMVDSTNRFVLVNSMYEELFGVKTDSIKGRPLDEVFPEGAVRELHRSDRNVRERKASFQDEKTIPVDGTAHTYLSVKFPIMDETGEVSRVCGISMDITELKKAQDQLRRLSANILASQEKERASIARELHDELGQVLTALRMDTVWIKGKMSGKDEKGEKRASSMVALIDTTISDVRNIAMRLRPAVLDDLGLIDALDWYTTDFEKRTGIACIFSHSHVSQLGDVKATAAYRIAQEALTNVARHSKATHVDVTLREQDGQLTLAVMDNGRGFDIMSLADADELGVAGMRERAVLVDGELNIVTSPDRGAKVFFRMPIDTKDRDKA